MAGQTPQTPPAQEQIQQKRQTQQKQPQHAQKQQQLQNRPQQNQQDRPQQNQQLQNSQQNRPQNISQNQQPKQGSQPRQAARQIQQPRHVQRLPAGAAGAPQQKQVPVVKQNDNIIFVGKKPAMNYVKAVMVQIKGQQLVHVRARGKSITKAVDVVEILRNKFVKGLRYGVSFETESLQNRDNRQVNVSVIDIKVEK